MSNCLTLVAPNWPVLPSVAVMLCGSGLIVRILRGVEEMPHLTDYRVSQGLICVKKQHSGASPPDSPPFSHSRGAAGGDEKDSRRQTDRAGTGFGGERRLDLAGDCLAGLLGGGLLLAQSRPRSPQQCLARLLPGGAAG